MSKLISAHIVLSCVHHEDTERHNRAIKAFVKHFGGAYDEETGKASVHFDHIENMDSISIGLIIPPRESKP